MFNAGGLGLVGGGYGEPGWLREELSVARDEADAGLRCGAWPRVARGLHRASLRNRFLERWDGREEDLASALRRRRLCAER